MINEILINLLYVITGLNYVLVAIIAVYVLRHWTNKIIQNGDDDVVEY
jgi:hypothetical protein